MKAKGYNGNGAGVPLVISAIEASRSFLPDPPTLMHGAGSSASAPTSRPLWPTPQAHDADNAKTPEQIAAMRSRTGAGVSNLNETASLWKTPHGIANMDASGKVAGGGGEFAKQVMQSPETWSTPRAQCNIQNKKNFAPPSQGGKSSKPGLQDQIEAFSLVGGVPTSASAPTRTDATTPATAGLHEPDASVRTDGDGTTSPASSSKAKLNPQFVEWLMGLPIGWTGFAPVAMESWRSKQASRLCFLLGEQDCATRNVK